MATLANWWIDLILAFVQGVTEIFPVSSSGRLVIAGKIAGHPLDFNQILFFHVGTFLAILLRYHRDVLDILAGRLGRKLPLYLLAALLTTGLIGLFFKNLAEGIINAQTNLISFMWIANGIAMILLGLISPQGTLRIAQLQLRDCLFIGVCQGITVLPGISRLGFTLGAGLLIGLIWIDALKLSFVLSLPTILFANLYELLLKMGWSPGPYVSTVGYRAPEVISLIKGDAFAAGLIVVTSFLSALLALQILTPHLSRKLLTYFGFYCLAAGTFFIFYLQLL